MSPGCKVATCSCAQGIWVWTCLGQGSSRQRCCRGLASKARFRPNRGSHARGSPIVDGRLCGSRPSFPDAAGTLMQSYGFDGPQPHMVKASPLFGAPVQARPQWSQRSPKRTRRHPPWQAACPQCQLWEETRRLHRWRQRRQKDRGRAWDPPQQASLPLVVPPGEQTGQPRYQAVGPSCHREPRPELEQIGSRTAMGECQPYVVRVLACQSQRNQRIRASRACQGPPNRCPLPSWCRPALAEGVLWAHLARHSLGWL